LQQDGTSQYADDAQIYEYEQGDQHHQDNGDGYADEQPQAQGHSQGHARQSSGSGSGQQNNYYYAQDTANKRRDDNDENGDMW
jgi:hypothetical protein